MQDTKERLDKIMAEQFGEDIAAACREGECFVDHGKGWANGNLDSLDKVELIMAVEDEFGIEIADYQAAGFKSLDDVATFVDAVTSNPKHGAH